MNTSELKFKLDEIGVYERDYSLNGELKPVSRVLLNKQGKWVTFFYDERGRIDHEKIFNTETEACELLFDELKKQLEWKKKFNIK